MKNTTSFNQTTSIIAMFNSRCQEFIKDTEPHWSLPTKSITFGVDSEYVQRPNKPNTMITTQLALSASDCVVLEHPSLGLNILPSWNGQTIFSTVLGWPEVEETKADGILLVRVLSFFAPADVIAALFNDHSICTLLQRNLTQDTRIRVDTRESGKKGPRKHHKEILLPIFLQSPYGVLQLAMTVDDYSRVGVGGLAQIVASFGGSMDVKASMDQYKANMLVPYTNPLLLQDFIEYAKDDAQQLFFLEEGNRRRTELLYKTHNMTPPEASKLTVGSTVAGLFYDYLETVIGEYKAYELFSVIDGKGRERVWKLEDLLHRSTVEYFASQKEGSKAALALVQGGRAKNETPTIIKREGAIADIDLSGAYVTIQKELVYPVGLPVVFNRHESDDEKMPLGRFLKKYGDELVPRLFVIVVNGTLNHRQTLVPSKDVDTITIAEMYNEDTAKIPADFRIYTKEIINGIITTDVLEMIRNVASDKELKQWMDLEVVTAAWYPANLRCDTAKEWYEKTQRHVLEHGGCVKEVTKRKGRGTTINDKRSRYWLAVPLKDFLGPYADMRKKLKDEMKKHPKGCEEYNQLDAQQQAMKLVGNTNYGVLASPYFPIGNVVVANNITAAVRVAVWATAVALGCNQTITDGGAYDLNAVRTWRQRKPSLNTLSSLRSKGLLSKMRRSLLGTKPLASDTPWTLSPGKDNEHSVISNGSQTIEAKEGGWAFLDDAALAHVREYFYDKDNPLSILDIIKYEHKDVYTKAIYHSQTNYQFTHVNGAKKTKARGHKVKGTPYNNGTEEANILRLMDALDKAPHSIPPYPPQSLPQVLKVNQANEMLTSKSDNVLKQNGLLAGDTITKRSWIRPLSLSMFHWETSKQYHSWERTVNSLKAKTGWGLEQYFLNDDGTLDYQRAIADIQDAIDAGNDWLFPCKGRNGREVTKATHPFFSTVFDNDNDDYYEELSSEES